MHLERRVGQYRVVFIGEIHDRRNLENEQVFAENYDRAIVLLEAPYITMEHDNTRYKFHDTSYILQLQRKYHHCMYGGTKGCPAYLFHIDIRNANLPSSVGRLASDVITQLSALQLQHKLSLTAIVWLRTSAYDYVKRMFDDKWVDTLPDYLRHQLHVEDATPHLLIEGRHPLAHYMNQLILVNPVVGRYWRDYALRAVSAMCEDILKNLINLSSYLTDMMVITYLLTFGQCDPLPGTDHIVVMMGAYHIEMITRTLDWLQLTG